MLGPAGERLTASRDFYAIFPSDEEWRLIHAGRPLGTIPLDNIVGIGSILVFGGRRWRVTAIDDPGKVLEVEPHRSGELPKFDKLGVEPMHDRLAGEMRRVLEDDDEPPYLDPTALSLLEEGRASYRAFGLTDTALLESGQDLHLLTWRGTRANDLLTVILASADIEAIPHDIGVTVALGDEESAMQAIEKASASPPDFRSLSAFVGNLQRSKYDEMVPEAVLRDLWVSQYTQQRIKGLFKIELN